MLLAALLPVAVVTSGCSFFGDDEDDPTSVFEAEPGMCFEAPGEVKAQVSEVARVPCSEGHAQEAYALVPYEGGEDDSGEYPGEETLSQFADGACAEEFHSYVGVSYLDSSLFFTYLLPSPRSWEEDDRGVLCLVTTTGETLTGSVKGTER